MKRKIIVLLIILFIVLLIPLAISVAKNLITYNPENGKTVIVAGEEIPEELMGEEVSIMIPQNKAEVSEEPIGNVTEEVDVVSSKDDIANSDEEIAAQLQAYEELEKNFDEILYKYYGTEKINEIQTAMQNESLETKGYTFPESGKTLLRCVIEIFDTMNPTEEEKQVLREFSQMLVSGKDINDDELKARINNL